MNIQWLRLSYNNIRVIPDDAFNGLCFQNGYESMVAATIYLDNNQISTISEHAFRGIIANKLEIHMTKCTLTVVPHQLKQITNLTFLEISENFITDVPAGTFQGFDHLRTLYMSRMNLSGHLDATALTGLEDT